MVVRPRLVWPGYRARHFVSTGSLNPVINARDAEGPCQLLCEWRVNGTLVTDRAESYSSGSNRSQHVSSKEKLFGVRKSYCFVANHYSNKICNVQRPELEFAGWKLASDCALQLVGAAMRSNTTVLQLTLRSGPDESRQYSIAFVVVDAFTLRALPFARTSGERFTLGPDTQHNFTVDAVGDTRIARGGVTYSWWFRVFWLIRFYKQGT